MDRPADRPAPPRLDREQVRMLPLSARLNRLRIERDHVAPGSPARMTPALEDALGWLAGRVKAARAAQRPVMLAFGAHTIKNGLAPVLIELIERGWITHLATNGAGIIHDWEFAWLGESSEDVRANVADGTFGNWEETGRYINLALAVGAYEGLGYGESVGALIEREALDIPAAGELERRVRLLVAEQPAEASAAADLLTLVRRGQLAPGARRIPHAWKRFSIQAAAWRLGVPFTGHPMFGHDIIYNHPLNLGAAVGRAAERDFLAFAHGVSRIAGGVYLSVGSAVMSPMVFEKSMSMAQNLAHQRGERIEGHTILVADLTPGSWDWSQGEPPADNPAYYLRHNKTFARMGGELRTVTCDNRDLLLGLAAELG